MKKVYVIGAGNEVLVRDAVRTAMQNQHNVVIADEDIKFVTTMEDIPIEDRAIAPIVDIKPLLIKRSPHEHDAPIMIRENMYSADKPFRTRYPNPYRK